MSVLASCAKKVLLALGSSGSTPRQLELLRASGPVSMADHGRLLKHGPVRREAPSGRIAEASGGRPWCEFLFHLAQALRPEQAVEMGVGVSVSYLAVTLKVNGRGRLR